ncbi:D-amino acid dehydrogenase [Corynebacterium diphtheriae]|nr:D-amino acid dehydrogenase [Corynebacterium diphtheriae]CAB0713180.1 D-amino acid dehydrogenase [Corynebacterium diphtheriae]CAB0761905.1 D-amino acid dehydrogenase [Corynebacterium diphtheriae]CAB0778084.1 D-amino acid dehydrogenase [Corynebacterium diphtheriae]CAB0908342.1 D-amino acid dehydrogenase [Corynebacterium diphtheriae]
MVANHSTVIGAGMVGLSTTWFLRKAGHEVTVIDRDGVAAGSSWGNAGWLSPGQGHPAGKPRAVALHPSGIPRPGRSTARAAGSGPQGRGLRCTFHGEREPARLGPHHEGAGRIRRAR